MNLLFGGLLALAHILGALECYSPAEAQASVEGVIREESVLL